MAYVSLARPSAKMKSSSVAEATALAETAAAAGKKVDMPVMEDEIMTFCSPCPGKQFNQIAVANRRLNIAWRRRYHRLQKYMLREGILGLIDTGPHSISPNNLVSPKGVYAAGINILLDLEDIVNTELATASTEIRKKAVVPYEWGSWRFPEEVANHPQDFWSRLCVGRRTWNGLTDEDPYLVHPDWQPPDHEDFFGSNGYLPVEWARPNSELARRQAEVADYPPNPSLMPTLTRNIRFYSDTYPEPPVPYEPSTPWRRLDLVRLGLV